MSQLPATPRPASLKISSVAPSFVQAAQNFTRQAVSQDLQQFSLRLQYPPLTRAEFGPIQGFLQARGGRARTFEVVPHTVAVPLGLGSAGAQAATSNDVIWSERLDLSPWGYSSAGDTAQGTAIAAPDGRVSGQLWRISAANAIGWPYIYQQFSTSQLQGQAIAWVYSKQGTATKAALAFTDLTTGVSHVLSWTWTAGAPVMASNSGVDSYGFVSIGSGWYRSWIMVDLDARNMRNHQLQVRVYPRVDQPSVLAGTYLWGVGVKDHVSVLPAYLRTWSAERSIDSGPRVGYRQNQLAYTEDFSNAYWTKGCYLAPYNPPEIKGYTTAPDGGLAAAWGTPAANDIYNGCLSRGSVVASAQATQYTFSIHIKKKDATRFGLNIYDQTAAQSHIGHWDFDGSGAPIWQSAASSIDVHGEHELDDGWWRVWIVLDAADLGLSTRMLGVYIYPHAEEDGTPRAAEGTYIWGAGFETSFGPGAYLERVATTDPLIDIVTGGTRLYTVGWGASLTGVLKRGDYLKLDGDTKVYMVAEDADSDAAGNAVLEIYPPLRTAPSTSEPIQVEDVPFTVAQDSDLSEWDIDGNGHYIFGLSLVEVPL